MPYPLRQAEPVSMNATSPHILIVHADPHLRRMLAMLLVEAGLKVRAIEPSVAVVDVAVAEPFDLILVGYQGVGEMAFDLAGQIRSKVEMVPVVMLLPELQVSLVVQGIRRGLHDVWPWHDDPKPVLRRVLALVASHGDEQAVTMPPIELSEMEASLAQMEPMWQALAADQDAVELQAKFRRALIELQAERDMVAAAQTAIDERARMLADERAAIGMQRQALQADRERLERSRQELQTEREMWSETARDYEDRENNLRAYERSLRRREERLSDRFGDEGMTRPAFAIGPHPADALTKAWADLDQARAFFEAEKAIFRDERLVLRDLDQQIQKREARLRELDQQLSDRDRVRRGLPPPPPKAFSPAKIVTVPPVPAAKPSGRLRGLFGRVVPSSAETSDA